MEYNIRDIIEYTVGIISDFAARHNLSEIQAYRYLSFHKGLSFVEENYGIIHTLSFDEALDSVALYCRKSGGKL